jgi:hypothetical protein
MNGVILLENEILLTGYARLPKGITATEIYGSVAVGILADIKTGEIIDIECSLVTDLARNFVRSIVKGHNLLEFDKIEAVFAKRYYGSAEKALVTAIKRCSDKYIQIIEN